MIDFLEGTIEELDVRYLVINVNGVGYGVNITSYASDTLKEKQGLARIYTYLSVRENAMELFGFSSADEREIFRALINVEGIGPRAGVNILSGINPEKLREAIANGDEAVLTRIPGLGPKKAQRIIVELKDKFRIHAGGDVMTDADEEFMEALLALGFNYAKAKDAVRQAVKAAGVAAPKETVIKEAIKRLGR